MADPAGVTNHEQLNLADALVLSDLALLEPGKCSPGLENKYWQRSAAKLIDMGFVQEESGHFTLTEEGRAFTQKGASDVRS